jgi:hypothetical protein
MQRMTWMWKQRIHILRALSQRLQSTRMPRFCCPLPSQPHALEIVSHLTSHPIMPRRVTRVLSVSSLPLLSLCTLVKSRRWSLLRRRCTPLTHAASDGARADRPHMMLPLGCSGRRSLQSAWTRSEKSSSLSEPCVGRTRNSTTCRRPSQRPRINPRTG